MQVWLEQEKTKLDKLYEALSSGGLIVIHEFADPDAVGSACALKYQFPSVDILIPRGRVSALSEKIFELFGYSYLKGITAKSLTMYSNIYVIDTASRRQMPEIDVDVCRPWVIDHHNSTENWDPSKEFRILISSTAEIIYYLLNYWGCKISSLQSTAILSGIVTDTNWFQFGDSNTFSAVSELLEVNENSMQDIYDLLGERPSDYPRRVAIANGMKRLEFERIGNGEGIIAITHVGSFNSLVARTLVNSCFDVAVVISEQKCFMSICAHDRLLKKGFSVPDVINKVRDIKGGGHRGMAVATYQRGSEFLIKTVVKELKNDMLLALRSRDV